MFDLVKKRLNFSTSYNSFLSMLFHLLQMPCGYSTTTAEPTLPTLLFSEEYMYIIVGLLPDGNGQGALQWDLVDRIIQQIVIQTKDGDPDVCPLQIDVKKITKQ